MKKWKSLFAFLLTLAMMISLNTAVFATEESAPEDGEESSSETEEVPAWKEEKLLIEQEKETIEAEKDALEADKDELEAQLAAAEASEDAALTAQLKEQIAALKEQLFELKAQLKAVIASMQEVMRNRYTKKELEELEGIAAQLGGIDGVTPIGVNSIYLKNRDIKFDTPPVIKENRILIPVRAISEAMGAAVEWDGETKTVTIVKDNTTIVFKLTEGKVFVNDVETEIDVPGSIMNNRTMVPLRFIAEQLDIVVEWDSDTGTAILSEEE